MVVQHTAVKILAINSSLRGSKGVSHYIIGRILSGARECGAKCESINLAEYKMRRCVGCRRCQMVGRKKKCIFDNFDDVEEIFNKIRNSDIVIYSTPVYIFTISSLLKTLLERTFYTSRSDDIEITDSGLFFHDIDTSVSRKPFVALILCDNIETLTTKNAISYFETYSKFTGSKNLGVLIRRSAGLFKAGSRDPKQQKLIARIDDAYTQAGRELALDRRISSRTLSIANQNIIRVPKIVKLLLKFSFFRNRIDMTSRIEAERNKIAINQ